uniref:Acetylglutamate kinase n=1 Tax=Rhodymenia pseudopalmata TaxID=31502 RepID=A0A1C9C7T7_RHOPU|nr:acetylglutamate kinase [Rhodymenia pseudopalmata]AOM64442.1 acetylglutamate kinase [Rhodymenia pseudopalmata]
MLNNLQRVHALNQSLSFIQSLANSTIVIKYGGAAMISDHLKQAVIDDIVLLSCIGARLVLVHGGGPLINTWLQKMNIQPSFKDGLRVTDYDTMQIVEMVLSAKINKELVSLIGQRKPCAVGLSGKDAGLIKASKLSNSGNDYAGSVKTVNLKLVNDLLNNGYIPVVSSVSSDESGETYNINADTVAGSIAKSLEADQLILLTDTPGIMLDINDSDTSFSLLSVAEADNLKSANIISGGMIPKVNCCIDALKNNVKSAHIIDGKVKHSLLFHLLTSESVGSTLTL